MKFLLWLMVICALIAWIARAKKKASHLASRPSAAAAGKLDSSEPMLQCVQCGVHIPASEAVTHAPDVAFCCEEHRRQTFPS
jgi:uncharacterized protein